MEEQDLITEEERNAPSPPPTPTTTAELFKDCIFYVEIRTERDNRSLGIKQKIIDMGAAVNDKLYVNTTHCIFKDGLVSSYQLAKRRNIPVVSLLWIEECKKYMRLVNTNKFKIYNSERYENPELFKIVRRMKSMQPDAVPREVKKVVKQPEVNVKAKIVAKKTIKAKPNPLPVVPKSVKLPENIVVPILSQSSIAILGSRRSSSRLSVMPARYCQTIISSVSGESESIENIDNFVKKSLGTAPVMSINSNVSSSCNIGVKASCLYQKDVEMEKITNTPSSRTIMPVSMIQNDVIMEIENDCNEVISLSSEEIIPTQLNTFNSPNSMETVVQKKLPDNLKIQQNIRKRFTTYTPQKMEETLNTKQSISRRTTFFNLNMTDDVDGSVMETPIRRSRFFDQIQSASILPFNSKNKVGKFERRSILDVSMSILNNNMSIVNSQSKKNNDLTPKLNHVNDLVPKRLLMNDSVDSPISTLKPSGSVLQTTYVEARNAGVKSPNDVHQEQTLVKQFKDIKDLHQKTVIKRRLYNVEEDYEKTEEIKENAEVSLKKPDKKKCKIDVVKPMAKKKALIPGINRVKKVVKKNIAVTSVSQPLVEDDDKNDTLKFFKAESTRKTPLRITASKMPQGPAKKYIVSTHLTSAEVETLKEVRIS